MVVCIQLCHAVPLRREELCHAVHDDQLGQGIATCLQAERHRLDRQPDQVRHIERRRYRWRNRSLVDHHPAVCQLLASLVSGHHHQPRLACFSCKRGPPPPTLTPKRRRAPKALERRSSRCAEGRSLYTREDDGHLLGLWHQGLEGCCLQSLMWSI